MARIKLKWKNQQTMLSSHAGYQKPESCAESAGQLRKIVEVSWCLKRREREREKWEAVTFPSLRARIAERTRWSWVGTQPKELLEDPSHADQWIL